MSKNITITRFKNLVRKKEVTKSKLVITDTGIKFAILKNKVGFYDSNNIKIKTESFESINKLDNNQMREYLNNLRLNVEVIKDNKATTKRESKAFSDYFFEVVSKEINARKIKINTKRSYTTTINKMKKEISKQKKKNDFEAKLEEFCLDSTMQSKLNCIVTLLKAYNDNVESNKMLTSQMVNRICKDKKKYRKDHDKKVSSFTLTKEDLLAYYNLARKCLKDWNNQYIEIKTKNNFALYQQFLALSKHLYVVFDCCRNCECLNLRFECFSRDYRQVKNENNKTECDEIIAVSFISRFIIKRVREIKDLLLKNDYGIDIRFRGRIKVENDFVFIPFEVTQLQKEALLSNNSKTQQKFDIAKKPFIEQYQTYKATKHKKETKNHITRTYFGNLCSMFQNVGNCYDYALLHKIKEELTTYKGNAKNDKFLFNSLKAYLFRDITFMCCLDKDSEEFKMLTNEFKALLNDSFFGEIATNILKHLAQSFENHIFDKNLFVDYFMHGFNVVNDKFLIFDKSLNPVLSVEIKKIENEKFWGFKPQTTDINDLDVELDMRF
ncbi:hypothetical protein [Helicobacter sp. T3_23-1056]